MAEPNGIAGFHVNDVVWDELTNEWNIAAIKLASMKTKFTVTMSIDSSTAHEYPCQCSSSCENSPDFPVNRLIEITPGLKSGIVVNCPGGSIQGLTATGKTYTANCTAVFESRHTTTYQKFAPWRRYGIAQCIVHLNDTHKWSRERIADWLDTLPVDLEIRGSNADNA